MHEVTAYKLCMVQGNKVPRIPRIFTFGRESNGIFCKGKNPAIGNGYFMGIAPKVFNGIAKSVKSLFYVRAPVFAIKGIFEILPSIGIVEFLSYFCASLSYVRKGFVRCFLKTCKMVFHYYLCR